MHSRQREVALHRFRAIEIAVDDADDFELGHRTCRAQDLWPPITAADECEANPVHPATLRPAPARIPVRQRSAWPARVRSRAGRRTPPRLDARSPPGRS